MITGSEKWDSREGTTGESASTDLRYIIRGTDDDTAARDALVANSPAFYNLLIRQSAHIARIGEAALGLWSTTGTVGELKDRSDVLGVDVAVRGQRRGDGGGFVAEMGLFGDEGFLVDRPGEVGVHEIASTSAARFLRAALPQGNAYSCG